MKQVRALSGRGPFNIRFRDGSEARFDADGNVVRGDAGGLTPNDVRYLSWRQGQDARWSPSKCADEWVRIGNLAPTGGI